MKNKLENTEVHVYPVKKGWITTIDIEYKSIYINKGFFTNGANIPRILWTMIPPNSPDIFPAVVVHDYLCDQGRYRAADDCMEQILIDSKISKIKRKSIVHGIRMYTKVGRPIEQKIKGFFK